MRHGVLQISRTLCSCLFHLFLETGKTQWKNLSLFLSLMIFITCSSKMSYILSFTILSCISRSKRSKRRWLEEEKRVQVESGKEKKRKCEVVET